MLIAQNGNQDILRAASKNIKSSQLQAKRSSIKRLISTLIESQ